MLASVDAYLGRRFVAGQYDCLAFARDVWREHTGEDLAERLHGLFVPASGRRPRPSHLRAFERLSAPIDPCIVLMRRPRTGSHVGVYLRGRVLHLPEPVSQFQPLEVARVGFDTVEFFR